MRSSSKAEGGSKEKVIRSKIKDIALRLNLGRLPITSVPDKDG